MPSLVFGCVLQTVKNAIGTAKSKHKQLGVQVSLASLPAEERFKEENLLLAALARTGVYKKHGIARVISGVDEDGTVHDEPNLASDLRRLHEGVIIEIPDDVMGGMKKVRLKCVIIIVCADYLAAQALLPWFESTGAYIFCRGCNANRKHHDVYRPFSFLRSNQACSRGEDAKRARVSVPELRTWEAMNEVIEAARAASGPERKAIMEQHGLKRLYFAFHPDLIPCNPAIVAPQDALHLFPDGLLRTQKAWTLYIFFRMGLKLSVVNARLKQYQRDTKDWPADVRLPPLQPKLQKGTREGCPKASATVCMTGHQMHWFSLHSIRILTPLLSAEMRAHPAWVCWLKLVELYSLVVQHELTHEDIERIDDLQLEHTALFDQVPEFAGLARPKHHFLTHVAKDAWDYGPPRGYWCFGFEGFNRVIKRGAQLSNWKDETMSILRYWSMYSAHQLCPG